MQGPSARGAEEKTVELPQGRIAYREHGTGEPIVFVHGLLVDGRLWRDVAPHLAERYRCIVPDWPLGSHRTALAPGADRTPRGIAHLIADFLQELELENVTIVGNDTGGAISQILASERPERIGALVLTNCDCLENFLPPVLRPLQWLAHVPGAYRLIAAGGQSARMRRSALGYGMLTHRPIADELTGSWLAPIRRPEICADMTATLRAIDRRDTLRAADVLSERPLPLLLAWAPDDRIFPIKFATRLQTKIPGARLERIADSRAFVPLDQPNRLADLVAEFVSRPGTQEAAPAAQEAQAQPGSPRRADCEAAQATSQHPTSDRS